MAWVTSASWASSAAVLGQAASALVCSSKFRLLSMGAR